MDLPLPHEGLIATHFVVAADVAATAAFYADVLGGELVFTRDPGPAFVRLANTWVIINEGGGPTPDKPEVTLSVPDDPNRASAFMNLRVADIQQVYDDWDRARGGVPHSAVGQPWHGAACLRA